MICVIKVDNFIPKRRAMLATTDTLRKKEKNMIDVNDKLAVEYLHLQYPWYTTQQIKEVIKTAGPSYINIDKQLRHKHPAIASK